jgi:hypothetical protein
VKALDPCVQFVDGQAVRAGVRPVWSAGRRLVAAFAVAVIALGLQVGQAQAQPGQLPCAIVGASVLNDSQRAAVRDFAAAAIADVSSDDHATSQRGVRMLMQPFACTSVSPDFRLEYSRTLNESLTAWARGTDARRAWVAMLVAGRCGTDLIEGVLRDGLRDERPAVRGAAAVGVRDAMVSVAAGQEGLRADRAAQLASLAFEQLARESDPVVAEQLANIVGAFQQSPELLLQHFASFANGVNGSIQQGRKAAAGASSPGAPAFGLYDAGNRDRLILLERSLDRVRVAMVNPRVRDSLRNSDTAAAGLLAGQALALVRDELAAGRMTAERLPAAERVLERAAEVLNLTGTKLGVTRVNAGVAQLTGALRTAQQDGNADAFAAVADLWIGPGGGLVGGVFGGRAESFAPAN